MAWNQPGEDRKRPSPRGRPDDGALDETLRRWQRRVQQLWRPGRSGRTAAVALVLLALLLWCASGYYQVGGNERGVLQRFGRYVEMEQPGAGWHWPWPIETLTKVDVADTDSLDSKAQMLTADQGILQISWSMQFRRSQPLQYLLNVREPVATMRQASETVLREMVAGAQLQPLLRGESRDVLAETARERIQRVLDGYEVGLTVTSLTLSDIELPDAVQSAERDATKAADDKQHAVSDAQKYANELAIKTQSEVQRTLTDAQVYATQTVATAQGEATRIDALADEYARAPQATRNRMYTDTMQSILSRPRKIVLDLKGDGNMIYLPIDKLLSAGRETAAASAAAGSSAAPVSASAPAPAAGGAGAEAAPAASATPAAAAPSAAAADNADTGTSNAAAASRGDEDERDTSRDRGVGR